MPDPSLDFKKKIIDEIVNSGIKKVTISGGEPLCTNNFLEVLEYMNKQNLEIILHTNGLLINEELAQKIAPLISRISLTIDAINTNTQIQMRKTDKITSHTIDLIKLFHNLNTPVNIKTLITKINKNEIEKIGEILKNLPIAYWSLLEFIPLGKGKTNQQDFSLESPEFDSLSTKIKNKFSSINLRSRRFAESKNKYCFIIPNGKAYTYIKNRGDVYVGDLNKEELKIILNRITTLSKD